MTIMLTGMAVLFGGLYGFQTFKDMMIRKAIGGMTNLPQTVSTAVAGNAPWQSTLNAVGSLRAVNGADLALQVAGIAQSIQFSSGDRGAAGQPLLSLVATDDTETRFNGKTAVYIGIQAAPTANLLDVINGVKAVLPDIKAQLPKGLVGEVLYDSTDFVNSSINEVIRSLLEAVLIVIVVVFLFLGSWRSVLIPVIAIPLSLIGKFGLMLLMGFFINLPTLLALVLAIGLVVDDAIIVVESVHRLIDEGVSPVEAAIQSARSLASPIIAMTAVLIAVYVPVGFQDGLTGALFTEFAFTLAGAVTVSAVIALTLSLMNCAWLLRKTERDAANWEARLVRGIDHVLERLSSAYRRRLEAVFTIRPVVVVFALLLLAGVPRLHATSTSELAPDEERHHFDADHVCPLGDAPAAAVLRAAILRSHRQASRTATVFQIDTPTQVISGWVLKPWEQRSLTTKTLQPDFQNLLGSIAGTRSVAFQPSPLPGSNGLPIQFVISTTGSFNELDGVSQDFMAQALKSGQFIFLDTDLKVDKPQTIVMFDRDKAGDLGLKMSDLGGALATMLGGNYLDYFSLEGRSYKVNLQVRQNEVDHRPVAPTTPFAPAIARWYRYRPWLILRTRRFRSCAITSSRSMRRRFPVSQCQASPWEARLRP